MLNECLARLEHGRKLINSLEEPRGHTCSRGFCNPLSEGDFIHMGLFRGPPLLTHVWLCKYRSYHVCTPDDCQLAVDGVCPVSGIIISMEYCDYDATNDKTWTTEKDRSISGKEEPVLEKGIKRRRSLLDSSVNIFGGRKDVEKEIER